MGRPAQDLTARGPFGTLRPLGRAGRGTPTRWVCHCDPALGGCGAIHTAAASNLVRGYTTSCGCRRDKPARRIQTLITE